MKKENFLFFYKKNKKFLGILMCELFGKEKNLIEKMIEKEFIYKNLSV
ncbi:hypothetical protein QIA19_05680 (plasmid) [Borreliella finlandensis]